MFPKVLKKILWILLWGGLLAFPTLEASAQFDASAILRNQNNQNPNDPNNPNNMLGSNPFQTQNGEEQPAMPTDSTKKKRLRKPLESYFFNDSIRALPNFSWTISRDYNQVHINPLDTTLATFRIDYPFYKEGVGHAALASLRILICRFIFVSDNLTRVWYLSTFLFSSGTAKVQLLPLTV